MTTLTVKEIIDLARFSGIPLVEDILPTEDELETEFNIFKSSKGVYCLEEGTVTTANYFASITDYPEEGSIPLGDYKEEKLDKNNKDHSCWVDILSGEIT